MGQAKRNREKLASEPCKCGSSKAAGMCCFDGTWYTKQPARISLINPTQELSVDGCYLGHTRGCGGPLTKEHLISRAVLNVLNQGELFTLSGAPWQQPDETLKVGLSTLGTKCLCKRHNGICLSALDTAAGRFFAAIKSAAQPESGSPISILVSGHDIERWMLKTLFALAHGKLLVRNRQPLPLRFHDDIDVARLLTNPVTWPARAGLYFMHNAGDVISGNNRLDLTALTIPGTDEIVGVRFSILGISFDFLADLPRHVSSASEAPLHRPSRLAFTHGTILNEVLFSWVDGRKHLPAAFDSIGRVSSPS